MAEEEETPQAKQQKLQQMMTEIREAQQNIETLENQIEVINNSIAEIESTEETLEGIENIEPGTEILVPIGSGSYIPAEIKDPDKVLTELGADLVAERPPKKVTKLVEKEKNDLEDSLEKAQDRIEDLEDKIEELKTISEDLRALSLTHQTPVISVCQINREGSFTDFKDVDFNSIAGSLDIAATADFIMILGQDEDSLIYESEVHYRVVKNRLGGRVGEMGKFYLDKKSLKLYDESELDVWIEDARKSGDKRKVKKNQ